MNFITTKMSVKQLQECIEIENESDSLKQIEIKENIVNQ